MHISHRTLFSWLCVVLVLVAGPMQAYGFVFCSDCEDGSRIEFSEPDGSCLSCPDEDSSPHHKNAEYPQLNNCGCVDEPLTIGEFAALQNKDHFQAVKIVSNLTDYFLKPIVLERRSYRSFFPISSVPQSSLTLGKSVVLLI